MAVVAKYCNEKARSEIEWFGDTRVLTPSARELLAGAANLVSPNHSIFGGALHLLIGKLSKESQN